MWGRARFVGFRSNTGLALIRHRDGVSLLPRNTRRVTEKDLRYRRPIGSALAEGPAFSLEPDQFLLHFAHPDGVVTHPLELGADIAVPPFEVALDQP